MRGGLLNVIKISKNKGLGEALRVAIENCTYELIARSEERRVGKECRL